MPTNTQPKRHPLHATRSGLHVARHPGRIISGPIRRRLQTRGWKHRLFDTINVSIVIAIALGFGIWALQHDPGRRVVFSAVVAPREVVSGGASTLSISYTNNSKKTLHDVSLSLMYPPYFVLQGVDNPSFEPQTNTITVGTLAPGANGLVKVRGVMFGHIGQEQTFTSTLAYTWNGERTGTQTHTHAFTPSSSALVVATELPDKLVGGQRLEGTLTLSNTGPIAFPEVAIDATFPKGFRLDTTSIPQRADGTWIVPSLDPSEVITITYAGGLALQQNEGSLFSFAPSFVAGDERFAQDTLSEIVTTLPPPFSISLTLSDQPTASRIPATLAWSRQSDIAIDNVTVRVEGAVNEPTFDLQTPVIDGERAVTLLPSVSGFHRIARFTPVAEFSLQETGDTVTVVGEETSMKLETPISISAFARYFTASGDQLGRGPLPPRAGTPTTYWVFLNVEEIVNDVRNVEVTAALPSNVQWIDQQSVTRGSAVTYDAATHRIRWHIPTLSLENGRPLTAASIALSLTPASSQIGSPAPLLQDIRIQAYDMWTERTVHDIDGTVTTRIAEESGIVRAP